MNLPLSLENAKQFENITSRYYVPYIKLYELLFLLLGINPYIHKD
jgi:hypothetical protein